MWLLPFARVSLDSSRSPDELVATLQRLTRPHRPIGEIRFIRPRETTTFVGDVSRERLQLRLAIRRRNSFAPYVIGRIVHGPAGARIEGVMRLHTITLIFVGVWLALLAPWAILAIRQLASQTPGSEPVAWIPLVMWLAMYPMCMIGFVPEALKMQRILAEIVGNRMPFAA
jgi:hypothetical protein